MESFIRLQIGTHCIHVGSAVHTLLTCLFTDTHTLFHMYMPDNIVDRALYSALKSMVTPLGYMCSGSVVEFERITSHGKTHDTYLLF